jgi:hypothetical protein
MKVTNVLITMNLLLLTACGGGGGGGETVTTGDVDTTGTTYAISVTVTGLTNSGLVLQNSGGDDLAIGSNGSFSFATELDDGSSYAVTVATQPSGQSCSVSNGSGTVAAADVSGITITCVTGAYTIGGSVSGLAGDGLVLQNNGGDDLSITSDGDFSFATALQDGAAYAVTIATQPSGQQCTVLNGSGTLSGAVVTDVLISCPPDAVTPSVSAAGPKLLRFSWNDVGADHYRLLKNPDGVSGFTQVGGDITATSVDEQISVHQTDWVRASYMVQACSAAEDCASSVQLTVNSLMLDTIGYIKPSYIGEQNEFATSIALSGDATTLAVGVPRDNSTAVGINGDPVVVGTDMASQSGAVYLFVREADGWSQQAYIKASNAAAGDHFGQSVSLSLDGNRLAVGATGEDSAATVIDGNQSDNTRSNSGAVYVFDRSGSSWMQQAYIKPSDTATGGGFGRRLSISGSGGRLAVSGGGVYLFEDGASGWIQQAKVSASNVESGDEFGAALQLSADGATLAVSSPGEDSSANVINGDQENNDADGAGAAYVFVFDGNNWSQQAYIKPTSIDNGDEFGYDLSISGDGDTLAVAAWGEDSSAAGINGSPANNNSENSGAVYLFERQAGVWSQTTYFKASNAERNDRFGNRVALSSDANSLAVSAAGEDSVALGVNGSQTDNSAIVTPPGAVYFFTHSGGSWSQQAYVKASNTDAGWPQPACFLFCPDLNDEYGFSLDISNDGTTLAVGAPYENSGDSENQQDDTAPFAGAVYLY